MNTSTPLRESDVPSGALSQMKAGAEQAARRPNEPPRDKLPPEAQRMQTGASSRWHHAAAAVNPFEYEELAALRTERLKRGHPLGDLPLVVMTKGISDEDGPDGKAFEAERRNEHAQLATLSRNGTQIIAARSGHHSAR